MVKRSEPLSSTSTRPQLSRKALLEQLSSDTSVESLESKSRPRKPIKVRNIAGLDRRVVMGERFFLLALATVGLLLHGLYVPAEGASRHAVDYALAPFAMGSAALLQLGLAALLATRKFTDPRLVSEWAALDSTAAMMYVMYLAVTSTDMPNNRNTTTLSLSALGAVFHTAMVVQDLMAFRRLHWALVLADRSLPTGTSVAALSADSTRLSAWTLKTSAMDSRPTDTHASDTMLPTPSSESPGAPSVVTKVESPIALTPDASKPNVIEQTALTTAEAATPPLSREVSVTMPTDLRSDNLTFPSEQVEHKSLDREALPEQRKSLEFKIKTSEADLSSTSDSDVKSGGTISEKPVPSSHKVDISAISTLGSPRSSTENVRRRYPEDDPVHGKRTSWSAP